MRDWFYHKKDKDLYLGQNNPSHQSRLGANWLSSSPGGKEVGVTAEYVPTVHLNHKSRRL